jgi:hypothetical protein
MLVMFKGTGCAECPFYNANFSMEDAGVRIEGARCALDGLVDVAGYVFDIKLGQDGKRKGNCPFLDPMRKAIEVESYE